MKICLISQQSCLIYLFPSKNVIIFLYKMPSGYLVKLRYLQVDWEKIHCPYTDLIHTLLITEHESTDVWLMHCIFHLFFFFCIKQALMTTRIALISEHGILRFSPHSYLDSDLLSSQHFNFLYTHPSRNFVTNGVFVNLPSLKGRENSGRDIRRQNIFCQCEYIAKGVLFSRIF